MELMGGETYVVDSTPDFRAVPFSLSSLKGKNIRRFPPRELDVRTRLELRGEVRIGLKFRNGTLSGRSLHLGVQVSTFNPQILMHMKLSMRQQIYK